MPLIPEELHNDTGINNINEIMHENFKDKRLLIIAHSYSNFVKDQVEALAPGFLEIVVLVRLNPFAEITNYIPSNYLTPFSIKERIDLTEKPSNIRVIPTPICYLPLESERKRLGERHFRIVDRTIQREHIRFDLIHAHFAWTSGYVGAKLKAKYNKPLVITGHGYDIYDLPFKNEFWREKITFALNSADMVITVSQSNLEVIRKLEIRTPVTVIPNGFHEKLFHEMDKTECRKRLNLPLDKKILLAVGHLYEIKGHRLLVEVINLVVKKHQHEMICYVVGSGFLKNDLSNRINELQLDDYLKLVGSRPHNQLADWFNAADLFVMPSLRESFGVVQLEALACGIPVVATINGGSEEIITSDTLGYLVDTKNKEQFAEMILLALEKEWQRDQIIAYAQKFTWGAIAVEILNVYTGLCSSK
jgi:glycosyltransferase involved in cell wall biosynthesis